MDATVAKSQISDAASLDSDEPQAEATSARPESTRRLPRVPEAGLAPSLERKRLRLYLFLMVADVAILISCFAVASWAYQSVFLDAVPENPLLPAFLLLPIYLTIALYNATYSLTTLIDWRSGVIRALAALLVSGGLLNFVAFFAKMNADLSRVVFVLGIVATGLLMVGVRYMAMRIIKRRWGPSPTNRLVIHAGGRQVDLPHVYTINAEHHGLAPSLDDPDTLNRLAHYLRNMDEVIVSCTGEDRFAWSEVLKASGVHGEVISDFARDIGALGILHHDVADVSTLLVSTGPMGIRARVLKRMFDLVLSAIALVALAPVFCVVALIIHLEDGGPVMFRQRRMGRGNRFFEIYKFRSMRVEESDAGGDRSASKDDDRITRIGRFIRRTSIDELPQILNVLLGDMSLVGPRPHALGSQAGDKLFWKVDRRYWQRHQLRPGITGLAQVRGFRGATDTELDLTDRLRADLEYLNGWSIWRDIKIVFATLGVLVHDRAF